jgi:hypothetical protein
MTMIPRRYQILWALAVVIGDPFAFGSAADLSDLRTVLEKYAHLDAKSLEKLQARQVVAENLDPKTDSEVAILGAVVVNVPRTYFLSRFRDTDNFMKSPEVERVGTVSDLTKLALPRADAEALRKCRPGNCELKLSAAMMQQIAGQIDGSRTDDSENVAFRDALINYVKGYVAGGHPALTCYDDKTPRTCVAKVLDELTGEFPLLQEYAPSLGNADGFLYWAEEKLGPLKPVVSITQVAIETKEEPGGRWSFIASKQIYADHYFRGSLALTVLMDVGHNSVLMLYINRSRVDGLSGWLGSLKRVIVEHKLRSGMYDHLAGVRSSLERSYQGRVQTTKN